MLRETNELPIKYQGQIVSAICVLHNFIQIHDPKDYLEFDDDNEVIEGSGFTRHARSGDITRQETQIASARRDGIAKDMWAQYQNHIR